MGELKTWVKKNSQYFKLVDGETVTVVFQGFKFVQSSFDADKQTVRYTLKTEHGIKFWDTGSKAVAEFFDKIKPGRTVKIKRWGTGNETKYILSVVETPPEPEKNKKQLKK